MSSESRPPISQNREDANPADATLSKPRRVIFPWAWVGFLVGGRLALQLTNVAVDFKVIATYAAVGLGVLGLSLWYLIRGRRPWPVRLAVAAAPIAVMVATPVFFEIRMAGDGTIIGLHRRGTAKADELLATLETDPASSGLEDWGPGPYDYPRFLGEGAWAEASGPPIAEDWETNPPVELWRREVGAGWSAFAVQGAYAVTQEQRGAQELVACYRVDSGEPVWSHSEETRFFEEMGRVGPRATPTIVGERVYTQGGTGIVNCLDGATGDVVWRVDTAEVYGAAVPIWGKSGSPLYVPAATGVDQPLVIISVGAPVNTLEESYDASLVAFDAATGEEVWTSGWRQTSYASPALASLHGEQLVLQIEDEQLTAYSVTDGTVRFSYPWEGRSNFLPSCSQPIPLPGDRVLLSKGYGIGASLTQVLRNDSEWSAKPLWSPPVKRVLQTKFSNVVVRDGYAYALNDKILQCVEIETGKIAWRARRSPGFKHGQLLLHGEHLLIMTEDAGQIVLARVTPERYEELAAHKVLSEGETCWNNPVVSGDVLLVRNAVEAAAYRLPLADSTTTEFASVPSDSSTKSSVAGSGS